jgi:hypothetical protein
LPRYLQEPSYRFDRRAREAEFFPFVLRRAVRGDPLPYARLTAEVIGSAHRTMAIHKQSHLLQNALDFIAEAVGSLRGKPDAIAIKLAVIYLDAGVELVLKERLVREHWTLVFRDPGSARRDLFDKGDFQSAAFDECIDRLIRIAGWSVSDADRRKLRQFRRRRNKLMHFGVLGELDALRAAAASALSFVLDFVNEHFLESLKPNEEQLFRQIREGVAEFERFVQERWKRIRSDIDAAGLIVSCCESCGQNAVIASRSSDHECRFCGHRCSAEEAADAFIGTEVGIDYYTAYKEGCTWPRSECPGCEQDLLVDRGGSGSMHPHERFICFGCGTTWMEGALDDCLRCGKLFDPGDDSMTVCDDCFEAAVARD